MLRQESVAQACVDRVLRPSARLEALMRKSTGLGLLSLLFFTTPLPAQPKEGLILFKDGFSVQGKIVELRDLIVDPASGESFGIAAGGLALYVDDGVRRVFFSPSQLDRVVDRKEG